MSDTIVSKGPQRQGELSDAQAGNKDPPSQPQEHTIKAPPPPNTRAAPVISPRPPAPPKKRGYAGEIYPLPRIIAPAPAPSSLAIEPPPPIQQQGTRRPNKPNADKIDGHVEEPTKHGSEDEGPPQKRQKVTMIADEKGGTDAKGSKGAANGAKGGGRRKKAGKVTVKVEESVEEPEVVEQVPKPQGRVLRSRAPKAAVPATTAKTSPSPDSDWYVPFFIVPRICLSVLTPVCHSHI